MSAGAPDTAAGTQAGGEVYDDALRPSLPLVGGCLAAVFAVFSVLHLLLLEGLARQVMVPTAAVTAALFAALLVVMRHRPVPVGWGHPVMTGALVLAIANSGAHLVLVAETRQSTNMMLVLVAAGVVLLDLRYLVAIVGLSWAVWAFGAYLIGPAQQWPHYVVGMAAATVLAFAVNQLRRTDVRDLAEARAAAEAAAVRDHLTGVSNRRGLAMLGNRLVEQARRQGDAVYCIFVDIDGLKQVNDAAGNEAGDEVLIAVAEALRQVTRGTDVVARWGGDEFCVVGPGPGMAPLELERRVRDLVAAAAPVDSSVWSARVSAGGAMLAPWDSGSLETLLAKADKEMYLRRALRERNLPRRRPGDRITD